ncbi:MAG: glycosyltransferase family 4 protein [Candidatus Aminicenantales bacterium]
MRIGFDVRPFLKEETGVGIYFKNLLFSLAQIDRNNEYCLFSSSFKDRFPPHKIPPLSKREFRDFHLPVKLVNFCWYRLGWPSLDFFFRKKIDLSHSPTPLLLPSRGKKIVTVYDLFFVESPLLSNKEAKRDFLPKVESSLQKADGVITISKFTKSQIINKFRVEESKIRVIYMGFDHHFWQQISSAQLSRLKAKYKLPPSFILFVGAVERRKNLPSLIKALKIIHDRGVAIPLFVIGSEGEAYSQVKTEIKRQSLSNWIRILGYIQEEELRGFFKLASLLVVPSLEEGFGLPVIEALASGLPAVISRTGALPEVAQEAALYFNPLQPEEIATQILRVLRDKKLAHWLITKGRQRAQDFSWLKTASQTLDFYYQVAAN